MKKIEKYQKEGKNIVIELDDEVEYIIDDEAVFSIEKGKEYIFLIRVVDRKIIPIELQKIATAIRSGNIVDYLDKDKV